MKNEKPILFSSEMIRQILAGNKTQTRRVIKNPSNVSDFFFINEKDAYPFYYRNRRALWDSYKTIDDLVAKRCPYGKVGDLLWVRETFVDCDNYPCSPHHEDETISRWIYKADVPAERLHELIFKPSIHMPKIASRITLEITNIRVEKLWGMSFEDAKAEGMECPTEENCDLACEGRKGEFRRLWDKINGKKYPWNSNPFVWVIEFKSKV